MDLPAKRVWVCFIGPTSTTSDDDDDDDDHDDDDDDDDDGDDIVDGDFALGVASGEDVASCGLSCGQWEGAASPGG